MGGSQAGGMLGSDIVGESGDSWHDEDGRTNSTLKGAWSATDVTLHPGAFASSDMPR
jgi:hypothetical protein